MRFLSILFVIRSCPGLFFLANSFIICCSSLGVHGLMELSTSWSSSFHCSRFVISFWFELFSSIVKQFSKCWANISYFSMLVSNFTIPLLSAGIVSHCLVIHLVAIHRFELFGFIYIKQGDLSPPMWRLSFVISLELPIWILSSSTTFVLRSDYSHSMCDPWSSTYFTFSIFWN